MAKYKYCLCVLMQVLVLSKGDCQSKNTKQFTLKGILKRRSAGEICLHYRDSNGNVVNDTTGIDNGQFTFKGLISVPTNAALSEEIGALREDDPNFVEIYIEPTNMSAVVKQDDFKNIDLTGSETENQFKKLDSLKAPLIAAFLNLNKTIASLKKEKSQGSVSLSQQLNKLNDSIASVKEAVEALDVNFIETHRESFLCLYLIDYYFSLNQLSVDSARRLFFNLKPDLLSSRIGLKIENEIHSREITKTGKNEIDFAMKDAKNNLFKLSHYKGKKLVLLDFWASWCQPCIEIEPKISDLYREYKEKNLIVVKISIDSANKAWLRALKKSNPNFINLIDQSRQNESLRGKYDITAIPELVLIDKNGIITNHYLGNQRTNLVDLRVDLSRLAN